MLQGTRLASFQESLSLDPPTSLTDLFVRANRYILHIEIMRNVGGNEDREWKRKEREGEEDSIWQHESVRRINAPRPQFNHYTRLLQPRLAILAVIEGEGLLQLPWRIDRPMGKNQEEYCRYHKTWDILQIILGSWKIRLKCLFEKDIYKDMCGIKEKKVGSPSKGKTGMIGMKDKTKGNRRGEGIAGKIPL